MKIIRKMEAVNVFKPEGTNIFYYLFNEYVLNYIEQIPNSVQSWHHHEKIWETLYVIEGVLIMRWKEGETLKEDIIKAGDLIETERTPHTLINNTNNLAKFIVIKQILKGENFSELLKTDKIVHHQK